MLFFLLLIGFAVGMGLSFQTSINGRLRKSVKSPFLTSLISFAVSTVFITVMAWIMTDSLWIPPSFFESHPWWIWLGGVLGLIFLTGNILLVPKLGAVQTVIFPVLGQILAGVLVDEFGLFGAPLVPMNAVKLGGTLLVIAGVLGVVLFSNQQAIKSQSSAIKTAGLWGWRILGIGTGSCSALQITINGQLGVALNSAFHAAFVSFIVGVVSLFIIVCIQHPKLAVDRPEAGKNPWWMWIGGFLGALYVLGNAFIGPQIGTGTAVVVGLLGLMTAGLIIDQTGILQSPRKPVSWQQIVSLCAMFGGVCMIRLLN